MDMTGNNIEGEDGFLVNYMPDIMQPTLIMFTEFNFVTETFTLTFSEAVDTSTFDVTGLAFQNFLQTTDPIIPLTGSFIQSPQDSHVVTITLNTPDIDAIKRNPNICTRRNTCWLTMAAGSVADIAGNPVMAIPSDEAIYGMQFVQDNQPPCLEYFDISIQNGTITLYFNEPVDVDFFRPEVITLQNNVSVDIPEYQIKLTGGTTTSPNGRQVVLSLSIEDLEQIKASTFIKEQSDTYISFTANLIRDTSFAQVRVKPISDDNATQVRYYDLDTISPVLVAASLRLDTDRLIVTFSEPVLPETLIFSEVAIQNSLNSPTVTIILLPGSAMSGDTTNIVVIGLNASNLITLKVSDDIATGIDNTVISINTGAITDTAGNNNSMGIIPIDEFNIDNVFTTIGTFTLDMNMGTLYLTFTDIVNTSTFNPVGVRIQDDLFASPGGSYILTESSYTDSDNGYVVAVTLSRQDLNQLKFNTRIATTTSDTWLTLRALTVKDIFLQDIRAVTNGDAIQAEDVVPDTTPPELETFDLDLNSNTLFLMYTETINISTFNASYIVLTNDSNGTDASSVVLSDFTIYSENITTIAVQLVQSDVNAITQNTELATSQNDTFLYIQPDSVSDQTGNLALGIDEIDALQMNTLTPDSTAPQLLNASIDFNSLTICLLFDETINASSVMAERITFYDLTLSQYYALIGEYDIPLNHSETIYIHVTDAKDREELIKIFDSSIMDNSRRAVSNALYITMEECTVRDMNRNCNEEIPTTDAFLVANIIPDTTKPMLTNFTLNLTSERLTLTFTETVRSITFDLTQIQLLTSQGSAIFYQLTGGIVESDNSYIITVILSDTDLDQLKINHELATDINDTYLSLKQFAVQDMFDNYITPLLPDDAIPADNVISDNIPPELIAFDLDMDKGTLTLSFTEAVNVDTLNTSVIKIQNAPTSLTSYILTGGSYDSSPAAVVTIMLTDIDLNMLKRLTNLAISDATTYISLPYDTIRDIASHLPIGEIPPTDAQMVQAYTQDSTPPVLMSFDFNIDGDMIFYFDETVMADSLNPSAITLITEPMGNVSYNITGGLTSNEDSTTLTLSLSDDDRNNIKRIVDLAISNDTMYISFTSGFIRDMNSNYINSINTSYPLQVSNYTGDTTPPQLDSFSLDMDSSLLYLTFTETIDASSVDVTLSILQEVTYYDNGTNYNLTNSSTVSEYDDTVIIVNLAGYDSDNIKAILSLAKSEASTAISTSEYAASDMSGIGILPIPAYDALPIKSGGYTPDTTGPTLIVITSAYKLMQMAKFT